MKTCKICGHAIRESRTICDSAKCRSENCRRSIKLTHAKYGGEITKFRKHNGMKDPDVRAKVSSILKLMKWRPPVRGGNGSGPTASEEVLARALGYQLNVIVPTGQRGHGYPTHFKLDLGNPELKIGVEVDGSSHRGLDRKGQDERKAEWLESRGWRIIRFLNGQILNNLDSCVRAVKELEKV